MALVLKPMRAVGSSVILITCIPQMPGITGAASPGDPPISVQTVRQHGHVNALSPRNSTWMAQARSGNCAVCYLGVNPYGVNNHGYFLCDPTLVDYSTITRTGSAPRCNINPPNDSANSWRPFEKTLGTAKVVGSAGPGSPSAEALIYEDRVRVITPSGITVANKIPFIYGTGTSDFLTETTTNLVTEAGSCVELEPYVWLRYIGGDVRVTFGQDSYGTGWKLYVGKIDPVTLEATVFALLATGAGSTTTTLTQANMLTAGISRWDHVFFAANYVFAPEVPPEFIFNFDPGDSVTVELINTLDVPPWYTMPGVDDLIPGGYFA